MKKSLIAFGVLLLLAFAIQLDAQIPRTLSYQGILTDNAGKARPDGDYQFTFCLYDTATGGAPIWTEQKTLHVKSGLFSTILGDVTPFGAAVKFDKQYWLGIRIGNEAEFLPLIPLTSVGYSLNAVRADTANVSASSLADTTWLHNGTHIYRLYGRVGIGSANPLDDLEIATHGNNNPGLAFSNDQGNAADIGYNAKSNLRSLIRMHSDINGATWEFQDRMPQYNSRFYIAGNGNIGIGTNDPSAKLEVFGGAAWTSVNWHKSLKIHNASAIEFNVASDLKFGIGASHSGNSLYFFSTKSEGTDAPPKYIMIANNNGLQISGRTKTNVLEITGSDFAEPFELSHGDSLPLGSLVVIDPEQPGKLKQATEPYDKRVAGVISGAGGIYPGIMVTKEDNSQSSQYVALTGKVYALATAANGAIEPGDLLTTSGIPGHAMKATDESKSHGTIIGKAMSPLKSGEGLVLVLVNLQ